MSAKCQKRTSVGRHRMRASSQARGQSLPSKSSRQLKDHLQIFRLPSRLAISALPLKADISRRTSDVVLVGDAVQCGLRLSNGMATDVIAV